MFPSCVSAAAALLTVPLTVATPPLHTKSWRGGEEEKEGERRGRERSGREERKRPDSQIKERKKPTGGVEI